MVAGFRRRRGFANRPLALCRAVLEALERRPGQTSGEIAGLRLQRRPRPGPAGVAQVHGFGTKRDPPGASPPDRKRQSRGAASPAPLADFSACGEGGMSDAEIDAAIVSLRVGYKFGRGDACQADRSTAGKVYHARTVIRPA